MTAALQETETMTDVTISHELIRDICYRMGWEPEDADSFIQLAEEGEPGRLRASIRQYWRWDYRGSELRENVRRACPAATLEEFNAAADEVWADLEAAP